jgi:hypothetical protein
VTKSSFANKTAHRSSQSPIAVANGPNVTTPNYAQTLVKISMGESNNNNNKLPIAVANVCLVSSFEWSQWSQCHNSKLRPNSCQNFNGGIKQQQQVANSCSLYMSGVLFWMVPMVPMSQLQTIVKISMGESNNNNKLAMAVANICLVSSFEWSQWSQCHNSKLRPKLLSKFQWGNQTTTTSCQ